MITYSQFCPVAKAAEVFGDRWTPLIMRELCFGTRAFGELLDAAPLISRTVLAQRLKQLQASGVVHIEAKPNGKGHLYRLTPAGRKFLKAQRGVWHEFVATINHIVRVSHAG